MSVAPERTLTRRLAVAMLALLVVGVLGVACIELDGQRIAWFHDVERDELRILLFYDGIHDSLAGESGGERAPDPKSPGQIRDFVEHGSYMLFDWFLHVDPDRFNRMGAVPDDEGRFGPIATQALALMNRVRVENLGWYRDADGRVGAVQRLVIPEVSRFMADLNCLIDTAWLVEGMAYSLKRTEALCQAAAREGYDWVALDGQALRLRTPMDPDEFARQKRKDLAGILSDFVEYAEQQGGLAAIEPMLRRVAHAAGGLPFSLIDDRDELTLILGHRAVPLEWDVPLRAEYEPSMEAVVQETVGLDLDAALVARLLAGDSEADEGDEADARADGLDDLLTWGPPEERVRALLGRAAPTDGTPGDPAAWEVLRSVSLAWNSAGRQPAMPAFLGNLETTGAERAREAWKRWYDQRRGTPADG